MISSLFSVCLCVMADYYLRSFSHWLLLNATLLLTPLVWSALQFCSRVAQVMEVSLKLQYVHAQYPNVQQTALTWSFVALQWSSDLQMSFISWHIMIVSFFSENYNFDVKRTISTDYDHIVISVKIIVIMQTYFVPISWVYYLRFHKQIMTAHARMGTDVKATITIGKTRTTTTKKNKCNPTTHEFIASSWGFYSALIHQWDILSILFCW